MRDGQNRWLPVVRRLAREVDVNDYIYDIDARNRGPDRRGRASWRPGAPLALATGLGTLLAILVPFAAGYRLVGAPERRLIDAVHQVDPNTDRWTDQELLRRLDIRREAMDLIERVVVGDPPSDFYPYLAELTEHPAPLVDPGRGPARQLLANANDTYPREERGKLVDRIVSLGAALGQPDVQAGLSALAGLERTTREALFASGAAGLKRLFDLQIAVDQATAKRQSLQDQLAQQKEALDRQSDWIVAQLEATQKWLKRLGRVDQQCREAAFTLQACMVSARNQLR